MMGSSYEYERVHLKVKQVCEDIVNRNGILLRSALVGSAYINQYIEGKFEDYDVLVQVPGLVRTATRISQCSGWSIDGEYGPAGSFVSLRNEEFPHLNLILVDDSDLYDNWLSAAEVCKHLASVYWIQDKATRVTIHQIIMDRRNADGSTRDD